MIKYIRHEYGFEKLGISNTDLKREIFKLTLDSEPLNHQNGGSQRTIELEKGANKATELKRFTISITPEMGMDLDSAKQIRYCRGTRNDMIRDLIIRGLATLKGEGAAKKKRTAQAGWTTPKFF